ncbi:MAG: class I SAM-dependent methyltransferase [Parahaliea sp.]
MAASRAERAALRELAGSLSLELLDTAELATRDDLDLLLCLREGRLALVQAGPGAPGPVLVDFGAARMRRRRRGGQNELLGRAVGVGRKSSLKVLDATAGLGRDSFVLADLGCAVTLCERHPVVAALLDSGLAAAAGSGDPWLEQVAARMRLHPGDARSLSAGDWPAPDVIYLDPMFPRRDKRAAVKKEMALFQRLLGEPEDERDSEDLLRWALARTVARVVVKRPPKAAPLGGLAPSHQISGKAVRFDVHVLASLLTRSRPHRTLPPELT